jgi:hypothetical protein
MIENNHQLPILIAAFSAVLGAKYRKNPPPFTAFGRWPDKPLERTFYLRIEIHSF